MLRAAREQASAEAAKGSMLERQLAIEQAQRESAELRARECKAELEACEARSREAELQGRQRSRRVEDLEFDITVLR